MPPASEQRWSSRLDRYRAFEQYFEMFNNGWEPDFSPTEHRRLVNLYDDSIRYGDRFLERLRADLGDDDPVFVVHADHGEEFGEHGRYGHQPYLTEELTHVPLVVCNAGTSGRVSRPVELRQLAPTIAELCGADHPFEVGSLFDVDREWVTSKVFAEGSRRAALRGEGWKYVASNGDRRLVDLSDDRSADEGNGDAVDEAAEVVEAALARHVAAEEERRVVRDAEEEIVTEEEL
jgi:arylsulfatase